MKTPITVINGMGRAVNPFEDDSGRQFVQQVGQWKEFNDTNPEHPVIGIPDTKPGEVVEAELVHQRCENPEDTWPNGEFTRQVYILSVGEEQKPITEQDLVEAIEKLNKSNCYFIKELYQQTAALREQNTVLLEQVNALRGKCESLRKALEEISQSSDPGSYEKAIIDMKIIAQTTLNNNKP